MGGHPAGSDAIDAWIVAEAAVVGVPCSTPCTLAERLERLLLTLLRKAGASVSRSRTVNGPGTPAYRVIVEYEDEDVARVILDHTLRILATSPPRLRAGWAEVVQLWRASTSK